MADRHNLGGILSDQQRYDTMACYGNHWIQTPRLMRWPMRASYSRLRMSLSRCARPHVFPCSPDCIPMPLGQS